MNFLVFREKYLVAVNTFPSLFWYYLLWGFGVDSVGLLYINLETKAQTEMRRGFQSKNRKKTSGVVLKGGKTAALPVPTLMPIHSLHPSPTCW